MNQINHAFTQLVVAKWPENLFNTPFSSFKLIDTYVENESNDSIIEDLLDERQKKMFDSRTLRTNQLEYYNHRECMFKEKLNYELDEVGNMCLTPNFSMHFDLYGCNDPQVLYRKV